MGIFDKKKRRESNFVSVRNSIEQTHANNGFRPSRAQEMTAESSPVAGSKKGNPFFDPWAPGGEFNRGPRSPRDN